MMYGNESEGKLRAVVLSALMVGSVLAMTITVSGPVAAAVNNSSFEVANDAVQSDDTITVKGDIDNAGNEVSFLIQDPADDDVATVTKTDTSGGDTSFSIDIDLSSLSFGGGDGSLDEGEAKILVDEGSSFESSEASDTFVVDDSEPSGGIEFPNNGAERKDHPTINGTASDNNEVETVELVIQNDAGNYWSGSSWDGSETTVEADGTNNWKYNTSGNISSDGTYDVSVRVTDTADNTAEKVIPQPGMETTEISYTVDSKEPNIKSVDITNASGGSNVEDGDTVDVTAKVSDDTSGVDSVTVDISELNESSTLTLEADSGETYTGSFEVDSPTAGDGSVDLTVTATDAFGNTNTDSDTLTLKTSVAGVGNLSIQHDFAGIVVDDDDTVTVNATGITDPQGNEVSGPTDVDIDIAGTTYSATVEDGTLEEDIDPTEIPNSTATGATTVEIAQADANADTATVDLVHEAYNLSKGYQVQGTPMPAERTVTENVIDVTTYDPTAEGGENEWVVANTTQSGEGYYIEGDNDNARIGYVFDTSVSEDVEARQLHEGYNLVGTSVDLSQKDKHTVDTDIGGATDADDSNVEVWVRDGSVELDQSTSTSAYDEIGELNGKDTDVSSFEAYFVYIENGEEVRNVDILGYDPSSRD